MSDQLRREPPPGFGNGGQPRAAPLMPPDVPQEPLSELLRRLSAQENAELLRCLTFGLQSFCADLSLLSGTETVTVRHTQLLLRRWQLTLEMMDHSPGSPKDYAPRTRHPSGRSDSGG